MGEFCYFVLRQGISPFARDGLDGNKVILLPLLLFRAVFSKANLVVRASPQPGAAELGKVSSYDPIVQATGLQGDYIRCYDSDRVSLLLTVLVTYYVNILGSIQNSKVIILAVDHERKLIFHSNGCH